jgi:hypothetical protein
LCFCFARNAFTWFYTCLDIPSLNDALPISYCGAEYTLTR